MVKKPASFVLSRSKPSTYPARVCLEALAPLSAVDIHSESITRDLLAFRLHKQFQGKNYAVAHEWRRTDVVVLASILRGKTKQIEGPKTIIEGKMVVAPGKDGKNIHKHLEILKRQLRQNALV
jgi:hypothetical protein